MCVCVCVSVSVCVAAVVVGVRVRRCEVHGFVLCAWRATLCNMVFAFTTGKI